MKRKTLAILTAAAMAAGSLSACVCVYAADDATHIYVLTAPGRPRMDRFCCNFRERRKWKK